MKKIGTNSAIYSSIYKTEVMTMKKIIAIIMLTLLIFSSVSSAFSETLTREEIPLLKEDSGESVRLVKLGILKGTGESLALDKTLTRAEAVCLIFRMHPENPGVLGMPSPEFSDLDSHWAYKEVTAAKKMGLVEGTGDDKFEPDRLVTGKEFAKIILSLLGYDDVTIENTYELAINTELISNAFTKSVVYNNEILLRSDAVRLCFDALRTKTPEGPMLYEKLISYNRYTEEDFQGAFGDGSAPAPTDEPEINNDVTDISLTDKIMAQMPDDKNYMFSPLSIKMAFALAASGADGETKAQILSALSIDDLEAFEKEAKTLLESYEKSDILTINVENAVWLNSSTTDQKFSEEYLAKIGEFYDADAKTSTSDTIVSEINDWVKEKTNNKITEIINSSDFTSMLLNAVYFKAAWEDEFSKGATAKDIFTDKNGTQKSIDFMNKTDYFSYFKDGEKDIICLPYKTASYNEETNSFERSDFNASMYLIKGEYSEKELEALIENNSFNSTYVALSMPKFEHEFETSLLPVMNVLGVKDAFDSKKADFSKMFDKGNTFMSGAIHKTYIKVDEEGTEAAAVTALAMGATAFLEKPEPIEVKFDSPFTFIIRDDTNGETLFIGEFAFA